MRFMNTRLSPTPDEEGHKQAYATIELAEYEIRDLRMDKVKQIEGGVSLHHAQCLIDDIRVLDRALETIRLERGYEKK